MRPYPPGHSSLDQGSPGSRGAIHHLASTLGLGTHHGPTKGPSGKLPGGGSYRKGQVDSGRKGKQEKSRVGRHRAVGARAS